MARPCLKRKHARADGCLAVTRSTDTCVHAYARRCHSAYVWYAHVLFCCHRIAQWRRSAWPNPPCPLVGPARPEQRSDPAGRALRASTEIPVSRLRRAGSGCLHRCRGVDCTCRCHGVCCPQDVSPRAPCSSFPRWGQSPVPPSSCHRRQKFALIRTRRRAGCWPGADLFLRHTNAHVSTKSGRGCNEVDPLVYLRSF